MKFELVVRHVPKTSFSDLATGTEIHCSWVHHLWKDEKSEVMSVAFYFHCKNLEKGAGIMERLKLKVMTKFSTITLADCYVKIDGLGILEFTQKLNFQLQRSVRRAILMLRPRGSNLRTDKAIMVRRDLKHVLSEAEISGSDLDAAIRLERVVNEKLKTLRALKKHQRTRKNVELGRRELAATVH